MGGRRGLDFLRNFGLEMENYVIFCWNVLCFLEVETHIYTLYNINNFISGASRQKPQLVTTYFILSRVSFFIIHLCLVIPDTMITPCPDTGYRPLSAANTARAGSEGVNVIT